jgi:hypothetical protein
LKLATEESDGYQVYIDRRDRLIKQLGE